MKQDRYSLIGRHVLHARHALRSAAGRAATGLWPLPLVFLHVPKCAGSSVFAYVKACVGSAKSGRTVGLEWSPRMIAERDISAARGSLFCSGHIGWSTFTEIQSNRTLFAFTFLRNPVDRALSLYAFLHANASSFGESLIPGIGSMSVRQFALSTDPFCRFWIDNYMTRQFGGDLEFHPRDAAEESELLDRAKVNLKTLNFIGFFDRFDDDFRRFVTAAGLPRVGRPARYNVGSDSDANPASDRLADDVRNSLQLRLRLDERLWEFANSELR